MSAMPPSRLPEIASLFHGFGANVLAVRDKAPIHKWTQWQTMIQSQADVDGFPWGKASGIGAVCGANGWRVFDFDQCKDMNVVDDALEALGLSSEYPWVVRSGSGSGFHIWIRCSDEMPIGRLTENEDQPGVYIAPGKKFHHLELRWHHHQTVLPPSTHESGGKYRFVNGRPTEAPAWIGIDQIVAAFKKITRPVEPKQPKKQEVVVDVPPTDPSLRSTAYGRWAAAAMESELRELRATGDGGRNNALNRAAFNLGTIVGTGLLGRQEVFEALKDGACSIGLDRDKGGMYAIEKTIDSGLSDGMTRPRELPQLRTTISQREKVVDDTGGEPWTLPMEFREADLPVFPIDVLPGWLKAFVEAEAKLTQTPHDLPAMVSLSVLSTALAKKVIVERYTGYSEPVNIFTLVMLPPGSRKSAVFRAATAPIVAWEKQQKASMGASIRNAEMRKGRLQAQYDRLERSAGRGDDTDRAAEQEQEMIRLADEIASIDVPVAPRLFADDTTPEKLVSLMVEQKGRIAILSSEGDIFDIMGGRYGAGVNLGIYLKGHAGDAIQVDRVGRPSESIPEPALTFGLTVQPDVLHGLTEKPGFRGRGLLGRFLYSLPRNTLGSRSIESFPIPQAIADSYGGAIMTLLNLAPDQDTWGVPLPHKLLLSVEAEMRVNNYAMWLEPQLGEYGTLDYMTDWAGKLIGTVLRIAGLLHVARNIKSPEPWSKPINAETMGGAIVIGDYLLAHARAAYTEMGIDPEVTAARRILSWIAKGNVRRFTKRDIYQGLKGTFKKVEAMIPALEMLVTHEYIRQEPDADRPGPGRRPSPVFEVNPLWKPLVRDMVETTNEPWGGESEPEKLEPVVSSASVVFIHPKVIPFPVRRMSTAAERNDEGNAEEMDDTPPVASVETRTATTDAAPFYEADHSEMDPETRDRMYEERANVRIGNGEFPQARHLAGQIANVGRRNRVMATIHQREMLWRASH